MKVKCIRNCTGKGYKDFKKGEVRDVDEKLAKKLVSFGYAEKAGKSTAS